VTLFDYIAAGVLLVSGLVGFVRGATREVTTVLAFMAAAALAMFALRLTGPIARQAIHAGWVADAVAVLSVFVAVYIVLRLLAGAAVRRVRATSLSGLDRGLGFGIGLARGVVTIGGLTLLIGAATSLDRMPAWVTGAKSYPLAEAAARGLKSFAPQGLQFAKEAVPTVENTVTGRADRNDDPSPPSTEDTR
jgi:membrane protein required for colicin V production